MKNDRPLLTPTAYLPPAHWVAAAVSTGAWWIEKHENYQKGGYRNRCRIVGPNGGQTLTVPLVKSKHQRRPVTEVRISYETDWWRVHEQAIRTAYGRAPYFEFYAEALFAAAGKRHQFLWQLNEDLSTTLLGLLQHPVSLSYTATFVPPYDQNFRYPDDLPPTLPAYPQVFTDRHGFTPGLSILDALFCLGPQLLTHQSS